MPSQPCGLHRRHSRIESVVPYTNAPAKKGQVYFGRFYLGKRPNRRKGVAFPRGGLLAEKQSE